MVNWFCLRIITTMDNFNFKDIFIQKMKTNMLVMFFGMMKMVLTMVIDKILILVIKKN